MILYKFANLNEDLTAVQGDIECVDIPDTMPMLPEWARMCQQICICHPPLIESIWRESMSSAPARYSSQPFTKHFFKPLPKYLKPLLYLVWWDNRVFCILHARAILAYIYTQGAFRIFNVDNDSREKQDTRYINSQNQIEIAIYDTRPRSLKMYHKRSRNICQKVHFTL